MWICDGICLPKLICHDCHKRYWARRTLFMNFWETRSAETMIRFNNRKNYVQTYQKSGDSRRLSFLCPTNCRCYNILCMKHPAAMAAPKLLNMGASYVCHVLCKIPLENEIVIYWIASSLSIRTTHHCYILYSEHITCSGSDSYSISMCVFISFSG